MISDFLFLKLINELSPKLVPCLPDLEEVFVTFLSIRIRNTGLVTGNKRSKPKASVRKPGVSIRAPARRISPPSTSSLLGISPFVSCILIFLRTPRPSAFTSQAPIKLTKIRRMIELNTPVVWAT